MEVSTLVGEVSTLVGPDEMISERAMNLYWGHVAAGLPSCFGGLKCLDQFAFENTNTLQSIEK